MFPTPAAPTGEPVIAEPGLPVGDRRGLMTPRRKHTRAQDRRYGVTAERRLSQARFAAGPPPF
jgi:hypothetical protein